MTTINMDNARELTSEELELVAGGYTTKNILPDADAGAKIGSSVGKTVAGTVGSVVGGAIGAAVGAAVGAISGFFSD